jgi:type II secretory pathway pseudopilin PulG
MARMRLRKAEAGISLIEVLVVIVLLLVGVFSVIRLFPAGFTIGQRTEEATVAARLAKSALDYYAATAASLPDGIAGVRWDAQSNSYVIADDITPDDLSDSNVVPSGVDPYYVSNINIHRRILGETVRIPVPLPTQTGSGSVYMLSSGPILAPPDPSNPGKYLNINISGQPMIRRTQESTGSPAPFLRSPAEYAIDYDDAQIGFYPVGYPRRFELTFSYFDADDGNLAKTPAAPQVIDVPAGYAGWFTIASPNNGQGEPNDIVPDSDVCARAFVQLAPGDPWSTEDPYQYRFLSPSIPAGGFANIGVLAFNPNGRDYVEQTSGGARPLTAKIDYDVLDWRILRDERPMAVSTPARVRLSLKNIKKVGDIQDDQTVYPGLFRLGGAPTVDLLVYDVATGGLVDPSNYVVDYKEGIVHFTDAFAEANANGTFRFFYKAHGDWGVQVQKALANYRRGYTARPSFGQFTLDTVTLVDGDHPRIYFTLSEAGKTVLIREMHYLSYDSTTGTTTVRRASNETYRINDQRSAFENRGGVLVTYVDLRDRHSSATDLAVGWPAPGLVQPVVGVQGLSFRARVIWQSGARVNETGGGNEVRTRYRKLEMNTVLTRTQ